MISFEVTRSRLYENSRWLSNCLGNHPSGGFSNALKVGFNELLGHQMQTFNNSQVTRGILFENTAFFKKFKKANIILKSITHKFVLVMNPILGGVCPPPSDL